MPGLPSTLLTNLAASLPLGGSSIDVSGNGNSGTDTAITYLSGPNGIVASFNGSSSKITTPILLPASGSFSLSFDFYAPDASNTYALANQDGGGTNRAFTCTWNTNKTISAGFWN